MKNKFIYNIVYHIIPPTSIEFIQTFITLTTKKSTQFYITCPKISRKLGK